MLERAVPMIRVRSASILLVAPVALVVVRARRPVVHAIGVLIVFIMPVRDPGVSPALVGVTVMVVVTVERSECPSEHSGDAVLVVVLVMDRVRERKNHRTRNEDQDPERTEPAPSTHPLEARRSVHGQCGGTVQRLCLQTQYDPRATLGSAYATSSSRPWP